jgi:hypothetical protein
MINYLDQLWRVLLLLLLLLSLSHVIDNITVELASHSSTANSLGGALKRGGEGMNPSKSQKKLCGIRWMARLCRLPLEVFCDLEPLVVGCIWKDPEHGVRLALALEVGRVVLLGERVEGHVWKVALKDCLVSQVVDGFRVGESSVHVPQDGLELRRQVQALGLHCH